MVKMTEEQLSMVIYKKAGKLPEQYGFIAGTYLPFECARFMGTSTESGYKIWKLNADGTREILSVDKYLNTEDDYRKHLQTIINFLRDAEVPNPEPKVEYLTVMEIIEKFRLNTLEAAEVYTVAREDDRSTIAWWIPKEQIPYLSEWKKKWDEKFEDMILYGPLKKD